MFEYQQIALVVPQSMAVSTHQYPFLVIEDLKKLVYSRCGSYSSVL